MAQDDSRAIVAATLTAALIQKSANVNSAHDAATAYYDVFDALGAEHDKRLQAVQVPGFNRPIVYGEQSPA